jgi:hypothetical protein
MSRWLFALLLVLNGAVLVWGYQRERSQEPELPPVPKGPYKIVLLSEVKQKTPNAEPSAPAPQTSKAPDQGSNRLGFPEPSNDSEDAASGISAAPEPATASRPAAPEPETSTGSVSIASGQPIEPSANRSAPHKGSQPKNGHAHTRSGKEVGTKQTRPPAP